MSQILVMDIETVPMCESKYELPAREHTEWDRKMSAAVQGYEDMSGDEQDKIWRERAGLSAEFGRVAAVCFRSESDSGMPSRVRYFVGQHDIQTESDLLFAVRGVMNNAYKNGMSLGGFSIDKFDIPFVFKRSMACGVNPSPLIMYWDKKPWEIKTYDLQKMWSNGSWSDLNVSLESVSIALGVTGKTGSGKDVFAMWYGGQKEEVAEYCMADVDIVSGCFNRMSMLRDSKTNAQPV